jgi:transcriptional regulator with XRE-family HTH domain
MNEGAKRLAAWRQRRGLTQYEAGKDLGIAPAQWSGYESGDRIPNRRTAIEFSKLAGIPVESWDVPVQRAAG